MKIICPASLASKVSQYLCGAYGLHRGIEAGSTQTSVGLSPDGPFTLHRDEMTPPPPLLLKCPSALYCSLLQYITI